MLTKKAKFFWGSFPRKKKIVHDRLHSLNLKSKMSVEIQD